jgi:MinD-like ATPase involved in chromosome partitioning or flagellar assembly
LQDQVIRVEQAGLESIQGAFSIQEFLQLPLEQTNNALANIVHQGNKE